MKRLLFAYTAGLCSAVALAYYAGPDAIVQSGLRLKAAQEVYAYEATPMRVLDESMVVEAMKPRRK